MTICTIAATQWLWDEMLKNDSAHLTALLWGLSEFIFVKHIEEFLAHSKCCVNNV